MASSATLPTICVLLITVQNYLVGAKYPSSRMQQFVATVGEHPGEHPLVRYHRMAAPKAPPWQNGIHPIVHALAQHKALKGGGNLQQSGRAKRVKARRVRLRRVRLSDLHGKRLRAIGVLRRVPLVNGQLVLPAGFGRQKNPSRAKGKLRSRQPRNKRKKGIKGWPRRKGRKGKVRKSESEETEEEEEEEDEDGESDEVHDFDQDTTTESGSGKDDEEEDVVEEKREKKPNSASKKLQTLKMRVKALLETEKQKPTRKEGKVGSGEHNHNTIITSPKGSGKRRNGRPGEGLEKGRTPRGKGPSGKQRENGRRKGGTATVRRKPKRGQTNGANTVPSANKYTRRPQEERSTGNKTVGGGVWPKERSSRLRPEPDGRNETVRPIKRQPRPGSDTKSGDIGMFPEERSRRLGPEPGGRKEPPPEGKGPGRQRRLHPNTPLNSDRIRGEEDNRRNGNSARAERVRNGDNRQPSALSTRSHSPEKRDYYDDISDETLGPADQEKGEEEMSGSRIAPQIPERTVQRNTNQPRKQQREARRRPSAESGDSPVPQVTSATVNQLPDSDERLPKRNANRHVYSKKPPKMGKQKGWDKEESDYDGEESDEKSINRRRKQHVGSDDSDVSAPEWISDEETDSGESASHPNRVQKPRNNRQLQQQPRRGDANQQRERTLGRLPSFLPPEGGFDPGWTRGQGLRKGRRNRQRMGRNDSRRETQHDEGGGRNGDGIAVVGHPEEQAEDATRKRRLQYEEGRRPSNSDGRSSGKNPKRTPSVPIRTQNHTWHPSQHPPERGNLAGGRMPPPISIPPRTHSPKHSAQRQPTPPADPVHRRSSSSSRGEHFEEQNAPNSRLSSDTSSRQSSGNSSRPHIPLKKEDPHRQRTQNRDSRGKSKQPGQPKAESQKSNSSSKEEEKSRQERERHREGTHTKQDHISGRHSHQSSNDQHQHSLERRQSSSDSQRHSEESTHSAHNRFSPAEQPKRKKPKEEQRRRIEKWMEDADRARAEKEGEDGKGQYGGALLGGARNVLNDVRNKWKMGKDADEGNGMGKAGKERSGNEKHGNHRKPKEHRRPSEEENERNGTGHQQRERHSPEFEGTPHGHVPAWHQNQGRTGQANSPEEKGQRHNSGTKGPHNQRLQSDLYSPHHQGQRRKEIGKVSPAERDEQQHPNPNGQYPQRSGLFRNSRQEGKPSEQSRAESELYEGNDEESRNDGDPIHPQHAVHSLSPNGAEEPSSNNGEELPPLSIAPRSVSAADSSRAPSQQHEGRRPSAASSDTEDPQNHGIGGQASGQSSASSRQTTVASIAPSQNVDGQKGDNETDAEHANNSLGHVQLPSSEHENGQMWTQGDRGHSPSPPRAEPTHTSGHQRGGHHLPHRDPQQQMEWGQNIHQPSNAGNGHHWPASREHRLEGGHGEAQQQQQQQQQQRDHSAEEPPKQHGNGGNERLIRRKPNIRLFPSAAEGYS